MRPFAFRAQAALDLRTRRDEEARRDLAAAMAALASAERALDQSLTRRETALADARRAESDAHDTVTLVWYRNWIISHQREIERCREERERRRIDADAARDRAARTHMDVRVLEKLKERARRTYDVAVQREEQKAMDWLAVLRSTRQPNEREDRE